MPPTRLIAVAVTLTASRAQAGLVLFDPPHQDLHKGEAAVFTLTLVAEELPDIQAVDLALRPPAGLPITFAYSEEARGLFSVTEHCTPCDWTPESYFVGAINLNQPAGRTSFVLGTLTLDTAGLPHDPQTLHSVLAGTLAETTTNDSRLILTVGERPNAQVLYEPIAGLATFRITPEPGTGIASLVALAAVGVRRRQRV